MRAQIVSFHCILRNRMGQVLSSTFSQDVITQTATPLEDRKDTIKGLAAGLQNLTKGEKRRLELHADEAYGFYDPELVMTMPRGHLDRGRDLKIGDEVVHGAWEGGPRTFRVTDADSRTVTLDGNHPLAGQDLILDIEATEARAATEEEIAETEPSEAPRRLLH